MAVCTPASTKGIIFLFLLLLLLFLLVFCVCVCEIAIHYINDVPDIVTFHLPETEQSKRQ